MASRMPGWVKFLTGLFAGGGVAMVIIDRVFAAGNPLYWQNTGPNSGPPEGMFTGIGIGAVVSAVVWLVLYLCLSNRPTPPQA
jgi:hypothetical protein